MLDPAGPAAAAQALLWWIMLAGAGVLFLLVVGLWTLAHLRPGVLARATPFQWIVGGGLVMPIPILILLTGAALVLGEGLLPSRADAAMRIEVEAERWAWTFRYPGLGPEATSRNVLHLPAGQPVELAVTSRDVIHSFWIPRLGGKIDAIPGHVNVIWLEADAIGTYQGTCAEYCGIGHDRMLFSAEAHAPEDLAAAVGEAR